jgi:hypothetical protein
MDSPFALDIELLQQQRPLLGLLISKQELDPNSQSLLARVQTVELIPRPASEASEIFGIDPGDRVILELSFDNSLNRKQKSKLKQLLRSFDH